MCGIVAVFSPKHSSVDPIKLKNAADIMYHRGPDGQNIWHDPKHQVGLGHARLSIIDLNHGHQPLKNQDATCIAVVNGELYDYKRIRAELQADGAVFRTESDSEILLHLWEKYGAECVHHMRGEFSFVLWDARQEVLFVGRDRFGIKPLYFAQHNENWFFGSEVKALKALGVPVSFEATTTMLAFTYGLCDSRTLFTGIEQLPPGHTLLLSKGHFSLKKYWDFNYPLRGQTSKMDFQEAVSTLRSHLLESVELRLGADVPVSVYLSGGIDSSVLAGMAKQVSSYAPKCYTVSFQDANFDELSFAKETADQFQLPLHVLSVSDNDLADHFSEAIYRAESLIENPAPIAKFLLSREVHKNGDRVVLTGEGSDEIFGGYAHFRQDMFLHNREGQDPAELKNFQELLTKANSRFTGGLLGDFVASGQKDFDTLLGFTPMIYKTVSSSSDRVMVLFDDLSLVAKKKDLLAKLFLSSFEINGQLAGRDPLNISMYLWSKSFLINRLLRAYGDGMEMSHSVEGRVPFLDHKLVEFVKTLPTHFKSRGLTDKYILREAAKPFISESIYRRQKHPFSAPVMPMGSKSRLNQFMRDTLTSDVMKRMGIFSKKACDGIAAHLGNSASPSEPNIEMFALRMASMAVIQEKLIES